MPIYELGYRHWEGPLRGPAVRCWRIAWNGIRLAFRSKLLRRLLVIAWSPLLYYGFLFFAVGYVTDPARGFSERKEWRQPLRAMVGRELANRLMDDPESVRPAMWSLLFHYFLAYPQSWLTMLIVAIVVPPLISQDVRSKAFLLYFSKPITRLEYLLGKAATALFYVLLVTLAPALILYAVSIAFSPSIATFYGTAPVLWRSCAVTLVVAIPTTAIALCFSSLTSEGRYAAFGWVAFWLLGELVYQILSQTVDFRNSEWIALLSLRETTATLTQSIFNVGGQLQALGDWSRLRETFRSINPNASATLPLVYLGSITVLCSAVLVRRVSAPMRI